jgi:hypothetical protein
MFEECWNHARDVALPAIDYEPSRSTNSSLENPVLCSRKSGSLQHWAGSTEDTTPSKYQSFASAGRPKKPPNGSKRCCPGGLDMATSCAGSSTTSPRCFILCAPLCGGLRSTYRLERSALRSASIDPTVFAVLSVCSACFGGCGSFPACFIGCGGSVAA